MNRWSRLTLLFALLAPAANAQARGISETYSLPEHLMDVAASSDDPGPRGRPARRRALQQTVEIARAPLHRQGPADRWIARASQQDLNTRRTPAAPRVGKRALR